MDLDVDQIVVVCHVMPCSMMGDGSTVIVRRTETMDIFISVQKCNLNNFKCRLIVFIFTTWGLSFSGFKFAFSPSSFGVIILKISSYNGLSWWWISLHSSLLYHLIPVQSKEAAHLNSTVVNSCKKIPFSYTLPRGVDCNTKQMQVLQNHRTVEAEKNLWKLSGFSE